MGALHQNLVAAVSGTVVSKGLVAGTHTLSFGVGIGGVEKPNSGNCNFNFFVPSITVVAF